MPFPFWFKLKPVEFTGIDNPLPGVNPGKWTTIFSGDRVEIIEFGDNEDVDEEVGEQEFIKFWLFLAMSAVKSNEANGELIRKANVALIGILEG